MELKDKERFAILLQNKFSDERVLSDIAGKISSRQHVFYNIATINNERTYIIYDVDKKYFFNMGTNKKLKFIWKDTQDFYIIDFSKNTKGNVISHLTFTKTDGDKIEGMIIYENVKTELAGAGKVITGISLKGKNGISIHFPTLDDIDHHTYEDFYIYYKQ